MTLLENDRVVERTLVPGEVVVVEAGQGFAQHLLEGRHRLVADEPIAVGGGDLGPILTGFCSWRLEPARR